MSADIFSLIAKEIETGNTDSGLWTRAFAESDGDEAKTKAKYIRLRHAILSSAPAGGSEKPSPTIANLPPHDPSISPAVLELRGKLKKLLIDTPKTTFYSTLGLSVDCSDDAIAAAMTPLRAREAGGEILPSDLRYAIETLGSPASREAYDRRLLALLMQPKPSPVAVASGYTTDSDSIFLGWWGSRKVSALIAIGAVLLFGVLSLGFFKTKAHKDIATGVVANQREAIQVIGENDAYRSHTERRAVDGVLDNQAVAIDHAARIANRREDTVQRSLEYQANYGTAQVEMQRARMEEQKKQAEWQRQQAEAQRQQREIAQAARDVRLTDCISARQRNNIGEIQRAC